jgi:hypothetical protein
MAAWLSYAFLVDLTLFDVVKRAIVADKSGSIERAIQVIIHTRLFAPTSLHKYTPTLSKVAIPADHTCIAIGLDTGKDQGGDCGFFITGRGPPRGNWVVHN